MSAQQQAKESGSGWGSGWVKCIVASFVITGALFFVPWANFLPSGVGVGEAIFSLIETIVSAASGAVMYPLGLLASWMGYEGLVLVSFLALCLLMGFEPKPHRNWALGVNVAFRFYAMFAAFMGLSGLLFSVNARQLNFLSGKEGTHVFEVVDALTPAQVRGIREGIDLSPTAGEIVLEKAIRESVLGREVLDKEVGFTLGSAQFLSLFETRRDPWMNSATTGPVCNEVRKNYLRSALVDRYVLTINNVPVSEKAGKCDWRWNSVGIHYRPSFLAK